MLLSDTDEFVTINPNKKDESSTRILFKNIEKLPGIREPGSVMTFLKNIIYPSEDIGFRSPCLPIYREQYSARESTREEVENGLTGEFLEKNSFDIMDIAKDTLNSTAERQTMPSERPY